MKVKIKSGKSKLSGYINKSESKTSNYLAVLLPGFLDSKDYPHLVQLGKDLSKLGFTAVRFDPTGVWQSEGDIKSYTVSQYMKDISVVINFMRRMNKRDYEKIVMIGHSLGGMMAILYSAQSDDIDGVVAIMAPYSQTAPKGFQKPLQEWRRDKVKVSYRILPSDKSRERKFEVPYSYIEKAKKYNVLKVVAKLKKPLLVIAGELDDKITPEEVKKIYITAKEPKKFVLLKGIEHDYRLNKRKVKIVNFQIINFLKG